jgi:putative SOS response-associated peptidase YedK
MPIPTESLPPYYTQGASINNRVTHTDRPWLVLVTRADYDRWLGEDPDPAELIRPFAGDMAAWPVSTRVNKADNDDAAILDPVEAAA